MKRNLSQKIHLSHDYGVPPNKLWLVATNYDALAKVCAKVVTFDGLPKGHTQTGQAFEVMVSLFGKLPPQPYHMEILSCDDDAMVLKSAERGMGVNSWRHTVTISKIEGGARLTDDVEIEAGWKTWFVVQWAKYMYRARHVPRLELLGLGGSEL